MDRGIAGTPGAENPGGGSPAGTRPETQVPVAGARLTVEEHTVGGSAVVAPAGELDHDTAGLLRDALLRLQEQGRSRIVVDCSKLEFCDSTGLNVLLAARLQAEAAGGAVHLAAMRPAVARVFEITGAETVFTVHTTLAEAVEE